VSVSLRAEALEWREVGGEVVALDLASSRYLAVNESGAALWPLLAQGSTRPALAAHLQATFGVDAERATADVDAFLADLAARGLLAEG